MDYFLKQFKKALDDLPGAFEKGIDNSSIDDDSKERLEAAFAEMLPKIKQVQDVFTETEKKQLDLNGKFMALSEDEQIALIEAALPNHTICPISGVNEYIKNEMNGNAMKFMRALQEPRIDYNTRYFEIIDIEKYFVVFPVSHLDRYLKDDDVIQYLESHPDALDKK